MTTAQDICNFLYGEYNMSVSDQFINYVNTYKHNTQYHSTIKFLHHMKWQCEEISDSEWDDDYSCSEQRDVLNNTIFIITSKSILLNDLDDTQMKTCLIALRDIRQKRYNNDNPTVRQTTTFDNYFIYTAKCVLNEHISDTVDEYDYSCDEEFITFIKELNSRYNIV